MSILESIFGPGRDYKATLVWEHVKNDSNQSEIKNSLRKESYRAKVPGGWLVEVRNNNSPITGGLVYLPDPNHEWGNTP